MVHLSFTNNHWINCYLSESLLYTLGVKMVSCLTTAISKLQTYCLHYNYKYTTWLISCPFLLTREFNIRKVLQLVWCCFLAPHSPDLMHLQYSEMASVNNALISSGWYLGYLEDTASTPSKNRSSRIFPARCLFVSTFSLCCGRDISMQMDPARGSAALIM